MKRAIVIYHSKTGITRNLAQQISVYIQEKHIETFCIPVEKYQEGMLRGTDYLLLGCWTKGLMVAFQKPDNDWCRFALKASVPDNTKVLLFATYKISAGSMFKKMAKHINHAGDVSYPTVKSRNGNLSKKDKSVINEFINGKEL